MRFGRCVVECSDYDKMVSSPVGMKYDGGECAATGCGVGRDDGDGIGARRVRYGWHIVGSFILTRRVCMLWGSGGGE